MQAQFTDQTRRAITYAKAEASERGMTTAEPEHLLLAVLRDEHGEARAELTRRGHSPAVIADEVRSFLDAAPKPKERAAPLSPATVVLSTRTEAMLAVAARITVRFGRSYTGTDHLLLALIAEPTETLAGIWQRHGVSIGLPPGDFRVVPVPNPPAVPIVFHERPEWNRYTFGAKQALGYATAEVAQSGYNRLTPAYLLAGILQESDTVAARALRYLGFARNELRIALADMLETGKSRNEYQVLFTKGALTALDEAKRVAERLGDKHIGTEHLLLGLLAGDGSTAELLRGRGVVTANFLTALRSVKRGRRAEGNTQAYKGIVYVAVGIIMIAVFLYVIVASNGKG